MTSAREVSITGPFGTLPGTLALPEAIRGIVVFAHGSGSSRHSPRNRQVAQWLNEQGCGTLLFDLLTPGEADDRRNVFDIGLLAQRVMAAARWLRAERELDSPAIGLFGASTGAAAAIVAAADLIGEIDVAAVVSRGGRPDLAGGALPRLRAATLLVVGSLDHEVLELNRQAQRAMTGCESQVAVVPGATHLFEEPGTLEHAATLASQWFAMHFDGPGT